MAYLLFDPQAEDPTIPKEMTGAFWENYPGAFMFHTGSKKWWVSKSGWRRSFNSEIPKEYLAAVLLLS